MTTPDGACRYCGSSSVTNEHHVYGERKCCPDCDHRPPEPPYCGRCEWDGKRLVSRCFLCARDRKHTPLSSWSAADLLDPEPVPPVTFRKPTRPSSLRGRAIPRRGHGASEGDPSL